MYKWNAEYRIIDDFLEPEDFEKCKSYFANDFDGQEVIVEGQTYNFANRAAVNEIHIDKENKIEGFDVSDPYVLELFIKYKDKVFDLMKELAPEKLDDYKTSVIEFVETPKGYEHELHCDHINKLLSIVIYISPDKNTGTILYKDKNGLDPYPLDWRPNRAFVFSRNDDSWHNFKNNHDHIRNTITWSLTPPLHQT